jgi:sulfoxide reductase heme-binding subunit YedZ
LSPPERPATAAPPGWAEKLFRSKVFLWVLIVLPGLYPAWPILRQDPTVLADPLKYLLHHFGFVACILLAAVLALTPLRVLFPRWRIALALNRHRRLIGVSAFFYALIHLGCQFLHEGGWPTFFTDIRKPFLFVGMLTFLILLVLAFTSFHFMVRWLGGRRWKNLHRLAYVAAGLAAYHQAAARKIFPVQVLWIFIPLALLELARIVRQRTKPAGTPVPRPSRG